MGAEFCGEVVYQAGKSKYEIDCEGAVGGSITVKQPYNYLTLCEVQAFGVATEEAPLTNVAKGTFQLCFLASATIGCYSFSFCKKTQKLNLLVQRVRAHSAWHGI